MQHQSPVADHRHRKTNSWLIGGLLAIAAGLLIMDRWVNLPGVLPYLLLLACPLMHLMHRGHGRNHKRSSGAEAGARGKQS